MHDSANDHILVDLSIELNNAYKQADAARAETEVLRKAILTLAQHLRMDFALDSLLRCVLDVVPYDLASVILTQEEESGLLFVASSCPSRWHPASSLTSKSLTIRSCNTLFI